MRSTDGTPLRILECIRFALKLGNKSSPVEALVLSHLGPDVMLINNSIMKAFGAKLDWAAERLLLKTAISQFQQLIRDDPLGQDTVL